LISKEKKNKQDCPFRLAEEESGTKKYALLKLSLVLALSLVRGTK
jgi:hypothetical protein